MKKLLVILVLVLSICVLAGCGKSNEIEGLIEQGKLYVGTSTDYAPYEFIDLTKEGDDKYVGSDIALAKEIANELGLELVIKAMAFDTLLAAIDTGKIDMAISGFTKDSEGKREASYLFSNSYYDEGEGDQILVFNKSKISEYKSLEDLNKAEIKVAAQSGSVQQGLVESQLPNATKVFFEDINNALTALNAGQYDAVALAATAAKSLLTSSVNSDLVMSEFKFDMDDSCLYVIMKKGNTELCEKVNVVCDKAAAGLYQTWVDEAQALFNQLGTNAGELVPDEGETPEEETPEDNIEG